MHIVYIPATVVLAETEDGLLLATVHVYTPAVVTVRVWVYCAVTGSSNTVWVPWVTVVESLVQVTVVAGPPVEIQVRVSWLGSNVTPPDIEMSPTVKNQSLRVLIANQQNIVTVSECMSYWNRKACGQKR